MYEELYEPMRDEKAYLKRIGLENFPMRADLNSLDKVIYAHLTHVAFENLDTWGRGVAPDLRINYLFDKIVENNRGGWCFELNSLFYAFLKKVGFECYMVISHVMNGETELRPPAHCSVIVTLDGRKYFCDVGFGGNVPFGAMSFEGESRFGFRLRKNGDFTELYNENLGCVALQFRDVPVSAVDFVPLNYYISQLSTSPFRNDLRVNIRYENGSASLVNREFKCRRGDEKIEKIVDADEIPNILREYFFINPETVAFKEV